MNSGKVRLNSGILERRHSNWDRALQHFRMARQIDNTYCEPDYWIGATLLQQGNDLDLGLQVGGRPHPPPPSMQTYITYPPPPPPPFLQLLSMPDYISLSLRLSLSLWVLPVSYLCPQYTSNTSESADWVYHPIIFFPYWCRPPVLCTSLYHNRPRTQKCVCAAGDTLQAKPRVLHAALTTLSTIFLHCFCHWTDPVIPATTR